jgi:hypothetical protein
MIVIARMLIIIYLQCPYLTDFINYLIHATPVYPSLCLQYFILLFTIATITAFIFLLLLLFHYYHHYKTVATNKPLRASLFPGAAELTTHLLRLINILRLPLCRINKFRFYFPQRLLRSPVLMGHHCAIATREKTTILCSRIFVLFTLHTLLKAIICCLQLNTQRLFR